MKVTKDNIHQAARGSYKFIQKSKHYFQKSPETAAREILFKTRYSKYPSLTGTVEGLDQKKKKAVNNKLNNINHLKNQRQ